MALLVGRWQNRDVQIGEVTEPEKKIVKFF